jgi:hypothetical protein
MGLFGRKSPSDTVISERDFSMKLPGVWRGKLGSPGGPIVYQSESGDEQVTISMMWAESCQDAAKQKDTLREMVEAYREGTLKAHGPEDLWMSEPTFFEAAGGPSAFWVFLRKSTQTLSLVRAACSAWMLAAVLYEHSLSMEQAKARGTPVLGSFTLTGSPP